MLASAVALAGGGAHATYGSCGAFSGGLMALSACFSPKGDELSDAEVAELEKARPRFDVFRDWFIREYGGVSCADVLRKIYGKSYNLSDKKETDELHRLQDELGFNCEVVTAKVVVEVARELSAGLASRA